MLQDERNEPPIAQTQPQEEISYASGGHTAALERLVDEVRELREVVAGQLAGGGSAVSDLPDGPASDCGDGSLLNEALRRLEESADENSSLRDQINQLQAQMAELEQQNGDLASQVAGSNIRKSVAEEHSDCTDALSWEERKALILRQMESDSFDSDALVENLPRESAAGPTLDPASYVEQLHHEMQRRDEEINELRCLLEQQAEAREGGVAIGAAAIAQMVDSDDLVREERQRLQQLQAEWEEKFRQGEIAASLERAKLSRERQELARKNEQLEEQLEHLRRESRNASDQGQVPSRRWLAKLGLSDSEE